MGSIANGIAGFAVCLGLTWGLLIFGELPPEAVPATFVQTLLNGQFTWVAKVWFIVHHVLLDTQLELLPLQLLVLGVLPWFVSGMTVGMLSRDASRGFAVGLFAGILSIAVGWLILFLSPSLGIVLPGDSLVSNWVGNPVQYLMVLMSFQAAALLIVSGAGGAFGGILTRRRH